MDSDAEPEAPGQEQELPEPEEEPDSFSRVDLNASPSQIAREFPDFPGASAAVKVEIEAGNSAGNCLAASQSSSANKPILL